MHVVSTVAFVVNTREHLFENPSGVRLKHGTVSIGGKMTAIYMGASELERRGQVDTFPLSRMLLKSSPAWHPRAASLRVRSLPLSTPSIRACSRYSTSATPPHKPPAAIPDVPTPAEVKSNPPETTRVASDELPNTLPDKDIGQSPRALPVAPSPSVSTSDNINNTNSQLEDLKESLRGWTELAATSIRKHADHYTARAATTFAQLGRELNKVTGYGEIEILKRRVVEQGEPFDFLSP